MPFQRIPRVSDLLPGPIKGLWTIGDTSSWHVEIGTNNAGDSGIRLYGADGATKLIDLNVTGLPAITGALIRTAATGQRVELDGNAADRVKLYSGHVAETSPGELRADVGTIRGHTSAATLLLSPDVGQGQAHVAIARDSFGAHAAVIDESTGNPADFTAEPIFDGAGNPYPKWGGNTQRTISGGPKTATVDASNRITVTHGVGATPIAAIAIGTDSVYGFRWRADLSDATNAVFLVRDSTGALVAPGTSVSIALISVG